MNVRRESFLQQIHCPFINPAINEGQFVLKMILHDRLRRKKEKTSYISEVQIGRHTNSQRPSTTGMDSEVHDVLFASQIWNVSHRKYS
jgi:hypothetical protein